MANGRQKQTAQEAFATRQSAGVEPVLPKGSIRFDWTMAALLVLLLAGFYLDLWAHTHGRTDNTFFTPWHAVLYSMLGAVGLFLAATVLRNHRRGAPWRLSLPPGYGLSMIGVGLFGVGGVGDLIWHLVFGIEFSVDALMSPTHLVLAVAGVLIVSGPLRAAWRRPSPRPEGWRAAVPAVLSLALLLSVLTAFTQFIHPMVDTWAQPARAWSQQSEVFVMNADGTAQTRLTISSGASDADPSWAPDGRSILFTRSRVTSGRTYAGEIFRMNADGSGITQVTHSPGWYGAPLLSPDGQTIAFSLLRVETGRWAVGSIGALGNDRRILTSSGGNNILDAWSPDGHRLLFHSDREGANQLYVMSPDGSGQTRLTTGSDNWGGSWAPDSSAIAFTSGRSARLQLYVMKVDGTDQRRLVTSAGNDWLPSWSPDGTRLVFDSDRDGSTQIYVVNQDGSGQVNLLRSPGVQLNSWMHRWSPDGRHIIYAAFAGAGNPPATSTPFVREALGAAAVIVQAALLMGILLLGFRGGTLPVGSITLIVAVNAALVSVLQDQYRLIPSAILGGVVGDLLLWELRPSLARPWALRLFAFLVPVAFYALYFATLQLTGGIGWSIHLWLGTTVVAGIVGLLLSFLVVPPASQTNRWVPE